MKSIRQFVNDNIGGKYDADGKYGYQCVDLIYFYLKEVFGKGRDENKLLGDAKYNYENIMAYGFTSEKYNGNNRPRRGDVISFKPEAGNGGHGHVGVCLVYDKLNKEVYILEQNGGRNSTTGNGNDAIRIKKVPFDKMLGWARFKNISSILDKDKFDKRIYNYGIYIENETKNTLTKNEVAQKAFYFLAGYKKELYGKDYNNIIGNSSGNCTRIGLIFMIHKFLNNVLGKNVEVNEIRSKGVWNGQRPNDNVTAYEFVIMVDNAIEKFGLSRG